MSKPILSFDNIHVMELQTVSDTVVKVTIKIYLECTSEEKHDITSQQNRKASSTHAINRVIKYLRHEGFIDNSVSNLKVKVNQQIKIKQ